MEENKQNLGNSKKIIGIVIAIVAVLCVGVGALAFSNGGTKKLTGTPSEVVSAAMQNTNLKAIKEQESMQKQLGYKLVNDIYETEANEVSFNFNLLGLKGVPNEDIVNAYIKDTAIGGHFQNTKDGSKVNGSLSITKSGTELLGASIFKDGNEFGMNVPKVLDAPYAVKLDTFKTDYTKSALYELMGGQEIEEGTFEEFTEIFDAFGEYMKGAMNLQNDKEFNKQIKELQDQLVKEAALSESEDTTITMSNGKEKKCRVYKGTLTGEQVVTFMKKEMDIMMNLDFVKNYFDVLAKQSGMTVDEMLEEFNQLDGKEMNVKAEIEFLVDDTYLVGANIKLMDTSNNDAEMANIVFSYAGEKNLTDEVNVKVDINDETSEAGKIGVDVKFTQNLGEEADTYNQGLAFSLTQNDKPLGAFNYNYAYDTKAKDNNLKVNFDLRAEDQFGMSFEGTGTKKAEAQEVSTDLSACTIKGNAQDQAFDVNFGLSYGVKAIKANDIVIDKTGVKYVLEMTQEELMTAMQTIQTNVQKLAAAFQ